jgi:hypothetical protein
LQAQHNSPALSISATTGNVGIGTSAPTEKLDVIGGALAAGNGTIRTGITYSSLGLLGTFTNHDLGLITNGTEKARITAAGRVGIGTTADYSFNDDAKLAVANTSGNSTISIVSGTGSTGYLAFADGTSGTDRYTGSINYLHASDAMTFNTNAGNERMRITSAGYVGIGTSSPTATLDVGGEIKLSSDLYMGNNRFIRFERNSGSTSIQTLGIPTGTDDVRLLTTGDFNLVTGSLSNLLTVKQSGNVGIGTTSPAYRFNVVTDAIAGAQNLAAIDRTAQNFVTFTNPQFSTDASMGLMLRVFPQSDARQGAGILASGGAANGETDLNLFVSSGSVSSTSYSALTLKGGSGNVGIGTSAPTAKLDVNQTNQSGDNDFIRLTTDATAGSLSLGIYPSSNNSLSFIGSNALLSSGGVTRLNAAAGGSLLTMNTDSIVAYVSSGAANPVERMRITSAGNVGIGTSTPTTAKLQIRGTGNTDATNSIFADNSSGAATFAVRDNGDVFMLGNVGIGTGTPSGKLHVAGGDIFLGASYALKYNSTSYITPENNVSGAEVSTGGVFVVKTGVSPAERLRVDASGNVGIGTTSPVSKLHVAAADAWMTLQRTSGTTNILDFTDSAAARLGYVGFIFSNLTLNAKAGSDIVFAPNNEERGRFTSNGLTFNGDTAAANALDDYEEGTFTATITPATSGTITSGGTFTTWTYTKIGRQVTISGVFVISSVASPVGATVIIGGLPFTIFNNNGAYGAFSAAYFTSATSADSAVAGRHSINTTQLTLGVDASTVAASDEIYVTATYFV